MKKVLSFCLVVLLVVGMMPLNAFAVSNNPENQKISDFFAEEVTEYLTLDGTDYRIDYYYQGDLRVIEITNCLTEQVDILTYAPSSGEMFYNESPFDVELGDYTPQADGEWTLVSTETYTISWISATGTAGALAVAGAIAAKVPGLGVGGVVLAIGLDVLAIIAGACAGATVTVKFYTLTFPFQPIQYMYEWTFTPWTGDATYGPFRIIMDNQTASVDPGYELQ